MRQLPIHPDSDGTPEEPEDPMLRRAQLAERISDWLDRVAVDDSARTTLATGLAGFIVAAEEAAALLDAALATDPARDPGDAEHALDLVTELAGLLVGEVREGIAGVEGAFHDLEDRLLELAPDVDHDADAEAGHA